MYLRLASLTEKDLEFMSFLTPSSRSWDYRLLVYEGSCLLGEHATSWAPFRDPIWCFLMPKVFSPALYMKVSFWFLSQDGFCLVSNSM